MSNTAIADHAWLPSDARPGVVIDTVGRVWWPGGIRDDVGISPVAQSDSGHGCVVEEIPSSRTVAKLFCW